MSIRLVATAGPLNGRIFPFAEHGVFLLERSKTVNPHVGDKERFISRIQFLVEVNPPRARVVDMGNPSGTTLNGKRVAAAELANFDEIRAGFTQFRVEIPGTGLSGEKLAEGSPSKKALRPTPKIPGYRIERELGRSPFGPVYAAAREQDNAAIVIKTIVPAGEAVSEQVDKFLQDVSRLWKIKKHAHIVPYEQIGEEDGVLWFAREQIAGTDLCSLLKEHGKMDEKTAVRLMLQILSALEHAHAGGVDHGGVKLSNVFLEEHDGKRSVRVVDFGVNRAYSLLPMSGLSLTDHTNSTIDWLAPEQISDFRSVGASADQFGAAVILYHLLTDHSPYNFTPASHPLGQILSGSIIALSHLNYTLSPNLVGTVERALALDPADRFPDLRAFAEAIFPLAK